MIVKEETNFSSLKLRINALRGFFGNSFNNISHHDDNFGTLKYYILTQTDDLILCVICTLNSLLTIGDNITESLHILWRLYNVNMTDGQF